MKMTSYIILFFSLLYSIYAVANNSIILGNGDWPPYASEKMPDYGIGSAIITKAFQKVGITVNYKFYPWGRSYNLAKKGLKAGSAEECCDGTILWRNNEERQKEFYVSTPVVNVRYAFFSLKSLNKNGAPFAQFQWKDMSDLKDFTIGTSVDYDYGPEFMTAQKNKVIRTERSGTDLKNLTNLIEKKIDIFPLPILTGLGIIKENFSPIQATQFTYNPKEFSNEPLCLLLSKNGPENKKRAELFEEGLKKLKESGEYDKIFRDFKAKYQ